MVTQSRSSQRISRQERIKEIPLDFAVKSIELIGELPEFNAEPIYDITEENKNSIRELIDAPFASFDGVEKYPTLEEKAAAIFCLTIRGHKFGNGNKRTAVMLLLALLFVNEKWIALPWKKLYRLAMEIAKDTQQDYEDQIERSAKLLSKRIIALEKVFQIYEKN